MPREPQTGSESTPAESQPFRRPAPEPAASEEKPKTLGNVLMQELEKVLPAHGFEPDFRPCPNGPIMDTEELRAWYNSGAYILCASQSEASANTVTEAVACGCVAVTTPVGNAAEWGVDGENCVIVSRPREGSLAALLQARMNRVATARAGIETVKQYDYRGIAKQYWEEVLTPWADKAKA